MCIEGDFNSVFFWQKEHHLRFLLFIVIAIVGWAWRQRASLPFITRPMQAIAAPFEYGASQIMQSLSSTFHIVDISLKIESNGNL